MISLERRGGRVLRIGHRGAAALAPENTIDSFRAAVRAGVDLVELDVLELHDGALVVAHSYDLAEVSHGKLTGSLREWTLPRLRASSPEVPTFDETLAFFANEAPDVGIHVDLKVSGRERDIVSALRGHGVAGRSFLTTFDPRSTRSLASVAPDVRVGLTVPRSVLGITENGRTALVARLGLAALRGLMPLVVSPTVSLARASALVLHHSAVRDEVVERAHRRGIPVVAWTVDDPDELVRVDAAGVNAIVTNDPAIFASTLET
jgi:glycerophosphoryl diester phosphodiesterase